MAGSSSLINFEQYKIKYTEIDDVLNHPLKLSHDLQADILGDKMKFYKYIDMDFDDSYEIIAFSDVHADYDRFKKFLFQMGFIITYNNEFKWNPESRKKLLVICGDLIDGKRGGRDNYLTENNELRLHVLLYNLRLDAVKHDSYIFCTMGNHDFYAFHTDTLLYHEYIDYKSANNFLKIYLLYLEKVINEYIQKLEDLESGNATFSKKIKEGLPNLLKDDKIVHLISGINKVYLLYFARNFILSRFYCTGHHFFLKINTSLFAHAGFYKEKNIFSLFENQKQNSNSIKSPQLIHRKILEKMANIDTHIEFLIDNIKTPDRLTYGTYYNTIHKQVVDELSARMNTNDLKISELNNYYKNGSTTSLIHRLFEIREFQKNCTLVDEVLETYGCNLLVVGHCPTCLGENFYKSQNISDIGTDCNKARIVFTCGDRLASVDIAFSSAFSPNKEFYEYLNIVEEQNEKTMAVIRFNKTNKTKKLYHLVHFNKKTSTVWEPVLSK